MHSKRSARSLPALALKPANSLRRNKIPLPSLDSPLYRHSTTSSPVHSLFITCGPIDPMTALVRYSSIMTEGDRSEITRFHDIFYIRQNVPSVQSKMIDSSDFFPFAQNDHICFRYQQLSELGRGSFGTVIKCYDHKCHRTVAVKLVREMAKIRGQIGQELEMSSLFIANTPHFSHHIVRVYDTFTYRSFVGFVFELLSSNLYGSLKANAFRPLEPNRVRSVMRNIALALRFLHDRSIIHCDLKPENVLWTTPRCTSVKLIDFGCCCRTDKKLFSYIQSRFYRAPEVILKFGYDRPIDIWSFGCLLAELRTGRPLFPGQDEVQQLSLIVEVLGLPPQEILSRSLRRATFFHETGELKNASVVPASRPLSGILTTEDPGLIQLVQQCLEWMPSERATVDDILNHPWMCKRRG
jgi:dual specificity tyrosine-phosphorylation-regulated kinase 2/3/4